MLVIVCPLQDLWSAVVALRVRIVATCPGQATREQSSHMSSDRGLRKKPIPRLWCHIQLNMRHPEFDLVPLLIGKWGKNTRSIYQKTGAKIRIRGRGSGHKEVQSENQRKEAPLPLHIAITIDQSNAIAFRSAVELVIELLSAAQASFVQWCGEKGFGDIWREELWKFMEVCDKGCEVLSGLLPAAGFPHEGRLRAVCFRRPWHRYFYAVTSSAACFADSPLPSGALPPSRCPLTDLPSPALGTALPSCPNGAQSFCPPFGQEELDVYSVFSSGVHQEQAEPAHDCVGGASPCGSRSSGLTSSLEHKCGVWTSQATDEDAYWKSVIQQEVSSFLSLCELR